MTAKEERNDEKKQLGVSEDDGADEIELEEEEFEKEGRILKLREKLARCAKERQEYLDGWQRAQADILNAKRRAFAERERDRDRFAAEFVQHLLPLADSFEGAMNDETAWERASESWRRGMEQIHSQFRGILADYGVLCIGSVGDAFDPHLHAAVSNEPVDERGRHGTITNVLQSGYKMGEIVLRPARVIVGEYAE